MDRIAEFFESMIRKVSKAVSVLVFIASMQVFVELVLRYFFNRPTIWGLELSTFMCGALYVLSGGFASVLDSHIRIDLVYGRVSERTRALIDLIVVFPMLMVTLVCLVWRSSIWFAESIINKLTSGTAWSPPLWPMRLVLLIGITLLILGEIKNLSRRVKSLNIRGDFK